MKTRTSTRRTHLALLIGLLVGACGGGGPDPGTPSPESAPTPVQAPAPANVVGTWTITETGTSTNCGEPVAPPYSITITQNDTAITVQTAAGRFQGTVNGNTVQWSGSYPEDGGTTTIASLTVTVAGNSLSGTSAWGWAGAAQSCSGTTNFTGARTVGSVPAAPASLTAIVLSSSSIRLSWTDASNNETQFSIERGGSAAGPFAQVGTVGAGLQTFTDNGLSASTTYFYRIAAVNGAGPSPFAGPMPATTSAPPLAPPTAPSDLTASAASSTSIALAWADNSGNETGFEIDRAPSAAGPFTQIAMVGAGVTSYTNTGLAEATTYHYRVRATNAAGDSANSGNASATTLALAMIPAAPSNLSAAATSNSSIELSWTDNAGNETEYKIERAFAAAGPFTQVATRGAGVTIYTDPGLTPSTIYHYRVRASNAAGDSAYSNVASATTTNAVTIPAAPTNLVASAPSSSSVSLSWTDNANNEDTYRLERATAVSGPFAQVVLLGAGTTSYTNTGLVAGATYYFRVQAVNAAGPSTFSNVSSVTVPATPVLPVAPSGLSATATSATAIALSWTDNASNETSFAVEQATSSRGPFAQIGTTTANVTTFTSTGLTANTLYYYRVRASNAAGASAYSNIATAATPAASQTVTLMPSADNLLVVNSTVPATAASVFATGELALGCNWTLGAASSQQFVCGRSLVRFNVASLSGRTIESATLRLTTNYAGVGHYPRNWQIWAVASPWSSTTVTWNAATTFQFYLANRLNNLAPPTFAGQQFNLSVTGIVQSWADGTFANNGVLLEIGNYTFPNDISLDAFAFYSTEDIGGQGPRLVVTYR